MTGHIKTSNRRKPSGRCRYHVISISATLAGKLHKNSSHATLDLEFLVVSALDRIFNLTPDYTAKYPKITAPKKPPMRPPIAAPTGDATPAVKPPVTKAPMEAPANEPAAPPTYPPYHPPRASAARPLTQRVVREQPSPVGVLSIVLCIGCPMSGSESPRSAMKPAIRRNSHSDKL